MKPGDRVLYIGAAPFAIGCTGTIISVHEGLTWREPDGLHDQPAWASVCVDFPPDEWPYDTDVFAPDLSDLEPYDG